MLEGTVAERGVPASIRCDNGPELTSRHFLAWCLERQIELVHIQPGKPTQNARRESFNGRLREECLAVSWFQNLFEARRKIAAWRQEYNEERPHSSLGYSTPSEFARRANMGRTPFLAFQAVCVQLSEPEQIALLGIGTARSDLFGQQ
jgi:putative transposase